METILEILFAVIATNWSKVKGVFFKKTQTISAK
jgi:hypothetical protein